MVRMLKDHLKTDFDPEKYHAYICDMDGTLYFQGPMRLRMLLRIFLFCLKHPTRTSEIRLIAEYRTLREDPRFFGKKDGDRIIIKQLSRKFRKSAEEISAVIGFFMFSEPLDILPRCRDHILCDWLTSQHTAGKKIFILSDYPAADKADAIAFCADGCYSPDGKMIRYLKPNPEGLLVIMKANGLAAENVLFIGDRYEKDGLCAEKAGVDFLLLDKRRFMRRMQYRRLEWI